MSDNELKACPFCGEKLIAIEKDFPFGKYYFRCRTCFAQGPKQDEKVIAIAQWNRRS